VFGFAPPHTYASGINSRSGTKYGGWSEKYLRSCNAYELEKKRKEEEEGKGVGESF